MTLHAPLPRSYLDSLKSYPYVLLSTHLRWHNQLFQRLLAELGGRYFVALDGPTDTLSHFLTQVRQAVEAQGGVTTKLAQMLSTQETEPEILANALVSDLSLASDVDWLVIDNFD